MGPTTILLPWQSPKPDKQLIEREYYGLTPAKVKMINATDFNPLPVDAKPSHWLRMQTGNLERIIRAGGPPTGSAPNQYTAKENSSSEYSAATQPTPRAHVPLRWYRQPTNQN